jgi:hypothetical protein
VEILQIIETVITTVFITAKVRTEILPEAVVALTVASPGPAAISREAGVPCDDGPLLRVCQCHAAGLFFRLGRRLGREASKRRGNEHQSLFGVGTSRTTIANLEVLTCSLR